MLKVENYTPLDAYELSLYADTDNVFLIRDRIIESFNDQMSIQGEVNSQYLRFQLERYYDSIDITLCQIEIVCQCGDGTLYTEKAVDAEYSSDNIRFGWVIPSKITESAGSVKISIHVSSMTNGKTVYVMKTRPFNYIITNSLDVELDQYIFGSDKILSSDNNYLISSDNYVLCAEI